MCNRYRKTAKEVHLAVTFGIQPPYEKDEEYPVGDIFPTGKKTPFYGTVIVQDAVERKLADGMGHADAGAQRARSFGQCIGAIAIQPRPA